jgi:DNA-binding PadR family transcriptional regulator
MQKAELFGPHGSYISKEIRKMVLKLVIMKKIKHGTTYSYAILKDLEGSHAVAKFENPENIKNEVYNTIKALEKEGYIKSDSAKKKDGTRVSYRLTSRGMGALKQTGLVFKSAVGEIIKLMKSG